MLSENDGFTPIRELLGDAMKAIDTMSEGTVSLMEQVGGVESEGMVIIPVEGWAKLQHDRDNLISELAGLRHDIRSLHRQRIEQANYSAPNNSECPDALGQNGQMEGVSNGN